MRIVEYDAETEKCTVVSGIRRITENLKEVTIMDRPKTVAINTTLKIRVKDD